MVWAAVVPVGFVVLKSGAARDEDTVRVELVQMVRDKIGPVAAFKIALVVNALPKTRSGKILRSTMRAIADGESYKLPATIEDASALDDIKAAWRENGAPS